MLKKVLFTIFIFSILIFPLNVSGQEQGKDPISLTVSPSLVDLNVEPKNQYQQLVKIKNNFSLALPVQIEITGYETDKHGLPDYPQDELMNNWIEIEPKEFIIESQETREVIITFHIPDNAEPGSHLATLLFKPIIPPDYFDAKSAHIVPYIGAVVSLNVAGEQAKKFPDAIKISTFENTSNDSTPEFLSDLKNEDVFHHKIKGEIVIYNIFKKEVSKEPIEGFTILPKRERIFTKEISKRLLPGFYSAKLSISEGSKSIEYNDIFFVLPNLLQTLIGIFILLLSYLGLFKRKNIQGFFTVLLSRETK